MLRPAFLVVAAFAGLGCSASIVDAPDEPADARPPVPGPRHPGDGPDAVFAVTKITFGDLDRAGRPDVEAWKDLGLDIDREITACTGDSCASLKHCAARDGADPGVFADGRDGIDNSFGARLVDDVVHDLVGDVSTQVGADLAQGKFTWLFAVDRLGSDRDYNPLPGRFYLGADLGRAPREGERWPIASASLLDPSDLGSARSTFAASWMTADTWVSGVGDLRLALPLFGARLELPIHHAVVTMRLAADRSSAANGVISGVLDPVELAAEVPRIAGAVDPALCRVQGIAEVQRFIAQAADIRADGDAGSLALPCDAISIGIGFEAERVELGDVVPTAAPLDPCGG